MGKKLQKGKEGNITKYIPRAKAIRKLQISLAQFRRLCIIKGVYPVEPKNKKKVNGGSTALRTFYYKKDIAYLLHEPILGVFRQEKIHARKLGKALGKKQIAVAKQILEDKPVYSLDHVIKERYPTFVDAVRDLDDALSMIALFATLPSDEKIKGIQVKECQRLLAEFQNYVVMAGCLKKVFLSIKGIYYQVEIRGQPVTWIAPYHFAQAIPHDVDFKVMSTFLEVHETLLGFVNFKLYSDLNLIYPPKLDQTLLENGCGLDAYILESNQPKVDSSSSLSKQEKKIFRQRVKSLDAKIDEIEEEEEEEDGQDKDIDQEEEDDDDIVPEPVVEPTAAEEMVVQMAKQDSKDAGLFQSCVFWISREVPRYSLEFIIRACGGSCGWDETVASGSPFQHDDTRITHHITDRSTLPAKLVDGREYLQPQWVYDCINAQKLVKTDNYHPGEKLPSHLSPFVVVSGEDEYNPEEAYDDQVMEQDETNPEEERYAEVEAETAGLSAADFEMKNTSEKPVKVVTSAEKEDRESKELSKIMMSKKDKKLYDRIQNSKNRKKETTKKLVEKRRKALAK